jgi:hypothetical protein
MGVSKYCYRGALLLLTMISTCEAADKTTSGP